jgi:capsular polysaccharide biosynthesis protein/Mrp family chromosome partitioning ATPase
MIESSSPPLRHYVSIVRRQVWLVIGVTVIAIGTAALISFYVQESVYRASMKIVVGQGGGVFQPEFGDQVLPFTQTMTNLLESDIVATNVIENLQLNETPKGLLAKLKVTTRTESSVLHLAYDSPNEKEAVAILSEIGAVFGRLVDQRLGSGAEGTRPGQEPLSPITVSVFDPAHPEPEAVSPQPKRTMVAAGVLGLLIGLVLAFARAALDDRIRGRREAEAWFGAPVIGLLPKGLGKRPYGLVGDPAPRNREVVEALYRLRANLQFAQGGITGGVLAVTGAVTGEGHTQVAANVGVRLAVAGYDVVCVEADLRRPQLSLALGVPPSFPCALCGKRQRATELVRSRSTGKRFCLDVEACRARQGDAGRLVSARDADDAGLVDVLEGTVGLGQALVPVQLEVPRAVAEPASLQRIGRRQRGGNGAGPGGGNGEAAGAISPLTGSLHVLPAGRVPANPTDVFGPERAAAVVEELRGLAQYVVIDTPPLLVFGDAFPLLRLADGVVVVAPDGEATRGVAVSVRSTLESIGVQRFSVVLTDANEDRDADSYVDFRHGPSGGERERYPSQTL